MSIVITVRGTNGSGKSTVVTRVMSLYRNRNPHHSEGRRQPLCYICSQPPDHVLYVPGHYNIACGGCDTIKTGKEALQMVRKAVDAGLDVLYEGLMVQDEVVETVALDKALKQKCSMCRGASDPFSSDSGYCAHCRGRGWEPGTGLTAIDLTTPIEECLRAIEARRWARGNREPLNPKNTTNRVRSLESSSARLRDAGVAVERLDREAAYLRCCTLLSLAPGAQ